MTMTARVVLAVATVIVFLLGVPAQSAFAAPDPAADICRVPIAQADADAARRDAHNARPHLFEIPAQQAASNAYDAEAAEINADLARDREALRQCDETVRRLLDAGKSTYTPDTGSKGAQAQIARIAALPTVSSTWVPPSPPAAPRRMTVPKDSPIRGVYDILRDENPGDLGDPTFQGEPKPSVGDPDPAFGGQTIREVNGLPDVAADHIVPLAELVQLPGFSRLTPENQWLVAHAPLNFQWMSRRANTAKNSGYAGRIKNADPKWVEEQDELQRTTRATLLELIATLIAAQ
ncbi:hypothetical protein [Williamsia sp.]|uniref:hypothetical protein n=1 Tax=Williamsia sp. TaxID=1872085 RepID=UPI001A1C5C16|nr:hypothetical protein [Williamsia sp.]MBJ7287759.1 hypothetical protein [Williamsia sp.]